MKRLVSARSLVAALILTCGCGDAASPLGLGDTVAPITGSPVEAAFHALPGYDAVTVKAMRDGALESAGPVAGRDGRVVPFVPSHQVFCANDEGLARMGVWLGLICDLPAPFCRCPDEVRGACSDRQVVAALMATTTIRFDLTRAGEPVALDVRRGPLQSNGIDWAFNEGDPSLALPLGDYALTTDLTIEGLGLSALFNTTFSVVPAGDASCQ